VGEALPARPSSVVVESGQAVRIMTGAPLPAGADAIVPAEAAAELHMGDRRLVRITESVPPGRHVGRRGEDIQQGSRLFEAGRVLRPQDVGVLASVGVTPVPVVRRPTVAILITGDELLPVGSRPEGFRIVDSNSVMLDALVRRDGVAEVRVQMIPDGEPPLRTALRQAGEDLLLVSGGSSVGQEDHAPRVLAELGELAVHGVALRPAGPTGVGFLERRPVFLLPGNPVSCLCAYDLFVGPAIRRLGGRAFAARYHQVSLPLANQIVSVSGRVDYVRVAIREGKVTPLAVSGASILSSTSRADGYVLVPAEVEEYAESETVTVNCYDEPR